VLRVGDVVLELESYRMRCGTRWAALSPKEFAVLRMLLQNAGRTVSRRRLLDTVWGPGHRDDNKTVEVHMTRLRKKLSACGAPNTVRAVRGSGYVFDLPIWS
jgi:DNA-binding response OmpR family regulator